MAIDKLLPRYLNKDDDARILKSIEMLDALNVRVSQDADGNAGVIKNVEGNTIVAYSASSDSLPAGTNRTIGSVASPQNDEVYYFVWNSNNNHSIYRYSMSKDRVFKVYQDPILKFKETMFVKGDIVINQKGETILYFIDGENAPKKINATKALRGGYPADFSLGTNPSSTLTDEQRLLFITTAKQPPLEAPTWQFFTDTANSTNNIYDKMFQFAYQYVYDDGEVSAISPYSTITYSDNQLLDGLVSNDLKRQNNALRVFVKTNVGDVSKIRVLARASVEGAFFVVAETENTRTMVVEKSVVFKNDASYSVVSNDVKNKLFDNVPLAAEAQAISGNRLMYGNYTEGYDNVVVDGVVEPNYKPRGTSITTGVTATIGNDSFTKRFELDLSTLPGTIEANSIYTVDFSIEVNYVKLNLINYPMSWREWQRNDGENKLSGLVKEFVNVDMTPIKVTESITATSALTRAQLAAQVVQKIQKAYAVSFDTVDQLSAHASKIYDVEEANADISDNERYGFFKGSGYAELTGVTYNSSTNKISGNVRLKSAQIEIGSLYGSTVDIGGDAPDYTDQRNIRDKTFAGYGLTVNYTGDNTGYNSFEEVLTDATFSTPALRYMNSYFIDDVVTNNSRYLSGTNGTPSFKAGATHSFGVVYYDDRNRSGGVNKLPDTYVKWFGERGAKGETSMVMRLKHNPPSWAKRWSPVYAGNTSIVSFLQYTTIKAFTATNPTVKNIASTYNDKIFVSMRSLAGKEDSYREAKGALIDYAYNEGDKVRILSFGGTYYPDGVEFNVVGYEYFDNSPTTNPILDDANDNSVYQTTGFFLVLEDNGHPKFGKAAVIGNADDWDNKCVIEILSRKKTTEGLPYYEIGKSLPIVNGAHGTERTALSGTFDVQNQGGWGFFKSTIKVYKGDIFLSSGGVKIKINNVSPSDDTSYSFTGDCEFLAGASNVTTTFTVQNADCVAELVEGDVWFRLRQLRYGTDITTYNYLTEYIEDFSLSDFFQSTQNSFGRANLYSPSAAQLKRLSSITYSEPFNFDNTELMLSSFNLSLANFSDFDTTYGGIKYLQSLGDGLACLQESKLSVIPVSRNIIQYASETSDLVASNEILGTPIYRSGDFGCDDNPESVIIRFGRIYFADVKNGKVLAFGPSGIEPISEKSMDSFFGTQFANAKKFGSFVDLNGGYDPDNDEYILSIADIYNTGAIATFNSVNYSANMQVVPGGTDIVVSPEYGSSFFSWESIDLNWESVFTDWEDTANGVMYFDLGSESGSVQLDNSLQGQNTTVDIIVTTTNGDFYALGSLSLSENLVSLTTNNGVTFTIASGTKVFDGFTVAYDAKSGFWNTFYSFIPERMGFIKNLFYTFKNGRMYMHGTNATRNNFYGVQYNTTLSIVSNNNPSMVKTYESVSLEGDSPWAATFSNSTQQSSVAVDAFEERERNYYAHINRDTLDSTSNIVSIGAVSSVSGSTITLTSRINDIAFPIGGSIYKVSGGSLVNTNLTVSGIASRTSITANTTVAGISANDNLLIVSSASIDGDPMRDSYIQVDLTNTDTTPVELYAVNMIFQKSNLHNQQGA
jgi:hypothetical protein